MFYFMERNDSGIEAEKITESYDWVQGFFSGANNSIFVILVWAY
jgi:hypothetical protein